jgi:hypothetical protein
MLVLAPVITSFDRAMLSPGQRLHDSLQLPIVITRGGREKKIHVTQLFVVRYRQ